MKQLFLFFLFGFAMFLQGCIKESRGTANNINAVSSGNDLAPSAKNTRGSSLPVVSLNVAMLSANGDNTVSYKIKSKSGQNYSDGVDYVSAVIDQNGNFSFNTNTFKNSLAKRFVVYDLSNPVDLTNTYSPAFGRGYYYQYNYVFTTAASQYGTNPFVPLQNLQVGTSECVAMTGNINGDGVNGIFKYTVRFHATKDDQASTPTAFATVTRISDTQ